MNRLVDFWDGTTNNRFILEVSTGNVPRVYIRSGGGTADDVRASSTITRGGWMTLFFVKRATGNMKMFLGNTELSLSAFTGSANSWHSDVGAGITEGYTCINLNGSVYVANKINHIAYFSKGFTDAEIANHNVWIQNNVTT